MEGAAATGASAGLGPWGLRDLGFRGAIPSKGFTIEGWRVGGLGARGLGYWGFRV